VERPFGKFLGTNYQLESEVKKDGPTRDGEGPGLVKWGKYMYRFSSVADPAAALERFRSCFIV